MSIGESEELTYRDLGSLWKSCSDTRTDHSFVRMDKSI